MMTSKLSQKQDQWIAYWEEKVKAYDPPDWMTENNKWAQIDRYLIRTSTMYGLYPSSVPAIFIIPPEAGSSSHIADFGPGQSIVETAANHYHGPVYWLDKESATKDSDIQDMITYGLKSLRQVGVDREIHLIGLCQGGWEAAIHAAKMDNIASLTLAGAPIDFKAPDSPLTQLTDLWPMAMFEALITPSGVMPGQYIVDGYKMLKFWDRYVGWERDLYENILNEKWMDRYTRFHRWFDNPCDLPGQQFLDIIKLLFKENRLIKGELEIHGKKVSLSDINCPVNLLAGTKDHITLKEQLFCLEDELDKGVPVTKTLVDAGHIGIFTSKKIIADYWVPLFTRMNQ